MRNGRATKDGFGRPKSGVKEDEVKRDIFVMILDDEPTVGERLKPVLEKKGVQVEIFTESQKALERLAEKKFHVLITDLKMSGPSGFDVLHFLREHSPDTRALITGYATIERVREAQCLNAEFVPKPFKLDQIVTLVGLATNKKLNYIIYHLKNKIYQIKNSYFFPSEHI